MVTKKNMPKAPASKAATKTKTSKPAVPIKAPAKPAVPDKAPARAAVAPTSKATPAPAKTAAAASTSKAKKAPKLFDIFTGAGFKHVQADGVHFTVQGRMGEIDHIFVWENVVLLCEETAGQDPNKHCTNKVFLHRLIADDWQAFYAIYKPLNPKLHEAVSEKYEPNELEVRHIYYSEEADVGAVGDATPFTILTRAQAHYFGSLVGTIHQSAKYELLKFLNIALNQTGESRVGGKGVESYGYPAFALPWTHTHYPEGFAVVSFYADPVSLIQRAYVLRRDGWEDPNLSYQRFVKADKLASMREYLAKKRRVFITNLIVTLPSSALIKNQAGEVVHPAKLGEKATVTLELPLELGTVGIVDGQHRILSYYEGDGPIDVEIAKLRRRQNLLVTGIIFPVGYTAEMRAKFEAEIFLGINDNQTKVNTQLRQDLETLIHPESPRAMARSVVARLSTEGPLAGKLQISQFDPPDMIASGSLGPYVVKTLMRKSGPLYKSWDAAGTRDLNDATVRQAYIDYCVGEIKLLLAGASQNLKALWKSVPQGGVLSTTAVGGLIMLVDHFASEGAAFTGVDYKARLDKLSGFNFTGYTSSGWTKMAGDLYAQTK